MIVSGAPQKNGDRHAMEVAEVALAFMVAVVTYKVPHAPSYRMKMRIGLHSGKVGFDSGYRIGGKRGRRALQFTVNVKDSLCKWGGEGAAPPPPPPRSAHDYSVERIRYV
jgi:hypothetical protein